MSATLKRGYYHASQLVAMQHQLVVTHRLRLVDYRAFLARQISNAATALQVTHPADQYWLGVQAYYTATVKLHKLVYRAKAP